jgi:tetratricopeptide (TPR) repeat protein
VGSGPVPRSLPRELGDQDTEARALRELGFALLFQGEYESAETRLQQSLRIRRQLGDRHALAFNLSTLGLVRYMLGDYDRARLYYAQFLSIVRQTQQARGVSQGLSLLAFVSLRLGDAEQAREYAQEGLRVGAQAADRNAQAFALKSLGNALGDLARLDEASHALEKALELRRQLREHVGAMACLADLANISLAQGNLAEAQDHVEEILDHLETGRLDGTLEPACIYLTCYRVLRANGEPRTDDILEEGYRFLQERASKVSDEGERRSFLENVADNREIVSAYPGAA